MLFKQFRMLGWVILSGGGEGMDVQVDVSVNGNLSGVNALANREARQEHAHNLEPEWQRCETSRKNG